MSKMVTVSHVKRHPRKGKTQWDKVSVQEGKPDTENPELVSKGKAFKKPGKQ